jgi:two-component system response regulator QseB
MTAGKESKTMRIGILEDDPAIGDLLNETLKRRGHTPSIYRDGWLFLEQIIPVEPASPPRPFDVVLIDLNLPSSLSGIQAVQQVRVNFPDLPIVVISAATSEHLTAIEKDYPGVQAFQKPFNLQDLVAALERD